MEARAGIFSLGDSGQKTPRQRVLNMLSEILSLEDLNSLYDRASAMDAAIPFADRALQVLQVRYRITDHDLERIPRDGPVVVVANHCFGGLEGIILCSLLSAIRSDVKIMANYILGRIPEMRDRFILVDPFGGPRAPKTNTRPFRECIQWLRQGGMLGVFPSGEVAHFSLLERRIREPPWSRTIAGMIRHTEATVVPIYFDGTNSLLFHLLGTLHPRLRTALLPQELANKMRRHVPVHVGRPIPWRKLSANETDRELVDYLCERTYHLAHRQEKKRACVIKLPIPFRRRNVEQPVAPPAPVHDVRNDVENLPESQRLATSGPLQTWYAEAQQIPAVLREIGRLREWTFRAVGEGTGRSTDLDWYDRHYLHLFVWHEGDGQIVGAYRMGLTDRILERHGRAGLYTHSVFKLSKRLLKTLDPAIELGRSFVQPEYQKNYASLLMLWRGIAVFAGLHPKYRYLFGPVSISDAYRSSSRHLMVAFLRMNNFLPPLAKLVRPRTPLRAPIARLIRKKTLLRTIKDLDEMDDLIADLEQGLEGMPVLLRQYLKLGGKLLGFNVDPKFSYVLDGLILVDLPAAPSAVVQRYMGKPLYESYMSNHGLKPNGQLEPSRKESAKSFRLAARSPSSLKSESEISDLEGERVASRPFRLTSS